MACCSLASIQSEITKRANSSIEMSSSDFIVSVGRERESSSKIAYWADLAFDLDNDNTTTPTKDDLAG